MYSPPSPQNAHFKPRLLAKNAPFTKIAESRLCTKAAKCVLFTTISKSPRYTKADKSGICIIFVKVYLTARSIKELAHNISAAKKRALYHDC